MTALKKRAQALENQFARQAEVEFKAKVRGSKMIGRWAAYRMGLDDVEAYARTVAVKQVVEPHRLLELLRQDFSTAGVEVSQADIDSRMHDFVEQATAEIYAGR
ncbi:MAG: ATPase inhibitor subunit zeta [Rhizobium sp.]|nr:ATPase inhibitor subunit zeta [Rhizobium sp.]